MKSFFSSSSSGKGHTDASKPSSSSTAHDSKAASSPANPGVTANAHSSTAPASAPVAKPAPVTAPVATSAAKPAPVTAASKPSAAAKPSPTSAAGKSVKVTRTRAAGDAHAAEAEGAAASEAPADTHEPEEEPIPPREGFCQTELVPFALINLQLYRDAEQMVARVEGKYFRSTDFTVSGDVLDTVTRVAFDKDAQPNLLHVHFGDRFESLEAWEPSAAAPAPEFQLDERWCSKIDGLLQARFPNTQIDDADLWKRKDMGVLRRQIVDTIGSNAVLLAKASAGQKNSMIASAVKYEVAQREGVRGKLELQEVCLCCLCVCCVRVAFIAFVVSVVSVVCVFSPLIFINFS